MASYVWPIQACITLRSFAGTAASVPRPACPFASSPRISLGCLRVGSRLRPRSVDRPFRLCCESGNSSGFAPVRRIQCIRAPILSTESILTNLYTPCFVYFRYQYCGGLSGYGPDLSGWGRLLDGMDVVGMGSWCDRGWALILIGAGAMSITLSGAVLARATFVLAPGFAGRDSVSKRLLRYSGPFRSPSVVHRVRRPLSGTVAGS
jgi:hypothetical protein